MCRTIRIVSRNKKTNPTMTLDPLNWQFSMSFSIIAGTAGILNSLIVLINLPWLRKLPPSSFLIFWMCAFDASVTINDLLLSSSNISNGFIEVNPQLCHIHTFFALFGSYASLLLCFGLTLCRYLIIIHKMKINRYWPTSYLIVIALISALVAGLPFIMQSEGWDYILRPSNVYCAMAWKERDARSLIVSFATLTICVLPMGFIGYVYATIYKQTAKIFQATSDALSKDTANMSAPCNTQEDSKTGKKGMKGFSGNGATPDLERGILIMAPENVPKSARRTSQQQNVSIGTKMSSTRLLVVDRVFLSAGDLKATSMAQAADLKPERRARPVKTEEQLLQDALLKQSIIIVSAFVLGWAPYLILGLYEIISGTLSSPMFDFLGVICIVTYEAVNPVIIYLYDRDIQANINHVCIRC